MALSYYVSAAGTYVVALLSSDTKPVSPPSNQIAIETDTGKLYYSFGAAWVLYAPAAASVPWGGITGTIAAQTDLKLDTVAAPTDVTTLNATTAVHGLLRKLDGLTTTFLRGDGTWAAPSASASDLSLSKLSPTANVTVTAGYSAYISSYYELVSAVTTEIGNGSFLEIG